MGTRVGTAGYDRKLRKAAAYRAITRAWGTKQPDDYRHGVQDGKEVYQSRRGNTIITVAYVMEEQTPYETATPIPETPESRKLIQDLARAADQEGLDLRTMKPKTAQPRTRLAEKEGIQHTIYRALLRLNWSQSRLAKEIGLSTGYVSAVMNGKAPMSANVIHRLSEALSIPVSELAPEVA